MYPAAVTEPSSINFCTSSTKFYPVVSTKSSSKISDEVFQANHSAQHKEYPENSSKEIASSNSNQEKEGPPQDSDIRQLIREEWCVEVFHAIAHILSIKEPEYSFSMRYEHPNTTPEMESDGIIKSGVEELIPIQSECEVTSEDESKCDMPIQDQSSSVFTTFSNPLFKDNDDLTSSDDESLSEEDVSIKESKVHSNPLFDDDEINSDELKSRVESNFVESPSNHDALIDSSQKIDSLEEFFGVENDDDSEGEINVVEELHVDNSISNSEIELSVNDESDFDNPSVPRPPPEPPNAEFDFELDAKISLVMNTIVDIDRVRTPSLTMVSPFRTSVEMSRDVLTIGSTMQIPLLYRGEYSQWVERSMNYLEEQTDGEAMINSIKNGDQPLPRVTQVSIAGTTSTEQPPLKDKSMWSDQEKRQQDCKRFWDALTRHMLCSEYGEQDRKAAVLYEYETFKAIEGELLHMDLFGPTFVKSLNKKSYCLVITDDYSRFTWVFFLATKDETSPILQTFITGLENQLSLEVKVIRSDNGNDFKNSDLNQFCGLKGIKKEFSVPRTPQQNGIAERKNKTLIKASRTMLADSLLPITFWAEAVNTACYVQNRVLVTKPHNKTAYELLHGKVNEGFLVGYSVCSKSFRVFNSRTRIIQETLHVNFLENKPNVTGTGPTWLFDIDSLTRTMNYQPVTAGNQTNFGAGFQDNFDVEKAWKEVDQTYVLFPVWYDGSTNPQNNDKDASFGGKEHDVDAKKPEFVVIHSSSSSAQTRK
nr:hypothetical protein [Tanacetum cinerariifolium]